MLENLVPKGKFGGIRPSYGGRANWKEKCPRGSGGLLTKSCPTLVTPWTLACPAPLSMGFSIHPGKNTGWVAISFSRGSCWPRDWTRISCIAGRYFTDCARPEAWQGTCDRACPEQKGTKKRKLKGDGEGTAGDQQDISYEHLPRQVHYLACSATWLAPVSTWSLPAQPHNQRLSAAWSVPAQEKPCPASDQLHPSPDSIKLFSFLYFLFHAKVGPSITFPLDSCSKILNSVPCLPPPLSWFPKYTLQNIVLILTSLS